MSESMFGPAAGGAPRELVKATIILEEPDGVGHSFTFDGGDDATALVCAEHETEPDADGKVGFTLRLKRVTRSGESQAKNRGQTKKLAKDQP